MFRKIHTITLICLLLGFNAFSQEDSTVNKKRLRLLYIGGGTVATTSLIGLGTIWYQDLSGFRFFNDNRGWAYMDKLGHAATAQHTGRLSIKALQWAGLPRKKAIWYGGMSGWTYLACVEVLDGMSAEWGFSTGDVIANSFGAAMAISQEILWDEQKILIKWSYSNSPYAQYRPEQLGSNLSERWLKDYNGQTYWLSANVKSLLLNSESRFPSWLNVAVGYGIGGYVGATTNPRVNASGELIPEIAQYQQYLFSPDIDLSRIKTKSKVVKTLLQGVNFIKVPLPGLEYHTIKGWQFRWLAI